MLKNMTIQSKNTKSLTAIEFYTAFCINNILAAKWDFVKFVTYLEGKGVFLTVSP
jgi:hypothetical protein